MRVRFFAYLRTYTGCAETDFPFQETIGALTRSLCDKYGDKLRQKIFQDGKDNEGFGPEIIILINGRNVHFLQGTTSPLKPDDNIDIFPLVAGG